MIDKKTTPPNIHFLSLAALMNFGFNKRFKSMAHMMVEASKKGEACASRAKEEGATTIECSWAFHNGMIQFAEPQMRDAILHLNEMCEILGVDMKKYLPWPSVELSEAGTEA